MSQTYRTSEDPGSSRRRGRPKGTGIDDSAVLDRINRALAADQALKPTTAIKRAGITDPSIVRRLRDKLRADQNALPTFQMADAQQSQQHSDKNPGPSATPVAPLVAPLSAPPLVPVATAIAPGITDPIDIERKNREAATLAAYLQAMLRSNPANSAAPSTASSPPAQPPPTAAVEPPPVAAANTQPHLPVNPAAAVTEMFQKSMAGMMGMNTGAPPAAMPFGFPMPNLFSGFPSAFNAPPSASTSGPVTGMGFPFMPPFLQPFQSRPDPKAPPQTPSMVQQVEGLKLAVEAMVAISRLQLHYAQNSTTYSPMALMLQGQTFMGQMLLASLTGQHAALKPKTAP